MVRAPQMLMIPKAAHSASTRRGSGTSSAMVAGLRKMPLPMVMPMMRAVPPQKPIPRRRSVAPRASATGLPARPGRAIRVGVASEGLRLHGDAVTGGLGGDVAPVLGHQRIDEVLVQVIGVLGQAILE